MKVSYTPSFKYNCITEHERLSCGKSGTTQTSSQNNKEEVSQDILIKKTKTTIKSCAIAFFALGSFYFGLKSSFKKNGLKATKAVIESVEKSNSVAPEMKIPNLRNLAKA